jgi:uncharacterized alkaline shock family protein YloU
MIIVFVFLFSEKQVIINENGGIYMKGQFNTEYGQIVIDEEVIAQYAGMNALECFGIVGMASISKRDGLVSLLMRDHLTKGVHVTIEDNRIEIDFHIIVVYGVSIATVTENLIENVKYKVETLTGMTVDRINVYVEGVRIVD